jgi:1-deoxy-D-xylulose-5-phosphate synthase
MLNQKSITPTLLDGIHSPDDIKGFSGAQLSQLADEIRSFILDVVSVHPGHLGASLGVVELTVALHYVFNTPYDNLIWDVGHQAYSHKILTGRKEQFSTLRQWNGVSGFPNPEESRYDAFATGHASTSVSAVLGMAKAAAVKGETDKHHIAVIGDGGLTGGMAFEAFNNVGDANVMIVLNDNGIAIDKNTSFVHIVKTW